MKHPAEPIWGEPPLVTVIREMEIADVIQRSLAVHLAEQDLLVLRLMRTPSK